MSVIKHEIHLLKNSLEKAIQPDSVSASLDFFARLQNVHRLFCIFMFDQILQTESEVWDILQALKKLPMTVELLRETMIGKTVHEAKKKYTSENRLFDESRMIVALWKKDCNIPKIEKTKDEASKEPRSRCDEDAADDGQQSKTSQSKPTKAKEEPAASPLIGFRQYSILKPIPERNDVGELVFLDYPNFRPNLTPKEVLQMGSFGGTYFRPITSAVTRLSYKDVWKELPADWLVGLKINTQVASSTYSKSVNKYNETCGGDLEMWESSGWITSIDPYGWFMWYCRYGH